MSMTKKQKKSLVRLAKKIENLDKTNLDNAYKSDKVIRTKSKDSYFEQTTKQGYRSVTYYGKGLKKNKKGKINLALRPQKEYSDLSKETKARLTFEKPLNKEFKTYKPYSLK